MHPLAVHIDLRTRCATRAALIAALALAAVATPAAVHAQKGQSAATDTSTAGAGGAIQGYVYFDADGDGAFGPSESAVAGVPIRLLGPEGVDTAATDSRGLYQFTALGAGSYDVAIDTSALAVLLGTADGLDVPGYDALPVAGETLSGVSFGLDASEVGLLAEALAKAVSAVQAALPNALPNALPGAADPMVAATDTVTASTAADDTGALTATAAMTATTDVTTTSATTEAMRPSSKGGRQTGGATTATTSTTAAGTEVVTTTAAVDASTTTAAGGDAMDGVVAAAAATSGGPATMPDGGLADLFGPGTLAALASVLGLLGGIGATRRRSRDPR